MRHAPALGAAGVLFVFAIAFAYLLWVLVVIMGLPWRWAVVLAWLVLMPGAVFGGCVGFRFGCWLRTRPPDA
jgi:hypothetical protein